MSIFGMGRGARSGAGVFFGFFLAVPTVFMLFWNEGRAVKRYKALKEGAGAVVSIAADRIDPANEGKLVHVVGKTRTDAPVIDEAFGISETAIQLITRSEMYQWIENVVSKGSANSTREPEVSYKKEWRSEWVDSSDYLQEGRDNPPRIEYPSRIVMADTVSLGAFNLPEFLVEMIDNEEPYDLSSLDRAREDVQQTGQLYAGGLYFGADPGDPAIGDIRVQFAIVRPGTTSVVARQRGLRLAKYTTETGGTVELVEIGEHEASAMFQMAQDRNRVMTWGIRIFGFFMVGTGFALLLGPLATMFGWVPILGNLVSAGTKMMGFLLGAVVWAFTVGTAWIFYRPILGVSLLVIAIGTLVILSKRSAKSAQRAVT